MDWVQVYGVAIVFMKASGIILGGKRTKPARSVWSNNIFYIIWVLPLLGRVWGLW